MYAISREQLKDLIQGTFHESEYELVMDTFNDLKRSVLDDKDTIFLKGDRNVMAFYHNARRVSTELAINGMGNSTTHFGESPTAISGFNKALLFCQAELEQLDVFKQGHSWSLVSHDMSFLSFNPLIHMLICDSVTEDTNILPHPLNFDIICKAKIYKNTSTCFILNDLYNSPESFTDQNAGALDILGIFYEINSWHYNMFMKWASNKFFKLEVDKNTPTSKALFRQLKDSVRLLDSDRFMTNTDRRESIGNLTCLMRLYVAINLLKIGAPFPCKSEDETVKRKYRRMCEEWKGILIDTKVGFDFANLRPVDEMMLNINEMGTFPSCGYLSTLIWKCMRGDIDNSASTTAAIDKLNLYLNRAELILMGTGATVVKWGLS